MNSPKPPKAPQDDRAERRAEALRANLSRRKAAQREQAKPKPTKDQD